MKFLLFFNFVCLSNARIVSLMILMSVSCACLSVCLSLCMFFQSMFCGFIISFCIYYDFQPILVHCRQGWGRTGTILALYLMEFYEKSAEMAIFEIRNRRPRSMDTKKQTDFLMKFEELIRK